MVTVKPNTALFEAAKTDSRGRHEYVITCPSSLNLSFAVWLIDDYSRKEPIGEVMVRLNGENITNVVSVKNLSGYHTFSGLPEGKYVLSVESEFYFSEERVLDTRTFSGSKYPVLEIILKPKPLYPFPDLATLLRGRLATAVDFVLPAGVTVEATSKAADWRTQGLIQGIPDEKGEFVLYFREVVKGKAEVILEIRGEGIEKVIQASIEEGRSTYTGIISIS